MTLWQHTIQCNIQAKKHRELIAAYEARWPNYCRECGGVGLIVYSTGSYYEPPDIGLCAACERRNTCPRCGNYTPDERSYDAFWYGEQTCPSCGLVVGDTSESCPEPHECYCQ